jgi:hypothetical protein
MKRVLTVAAMAMAATVLTAPGASATIHPIVESADCASQTADDAHPLGDVADPPGQTPGFGNHSETSTLRAIQEANTAAFGKFDGECP